MPIHILNEEIDFPDPNEAGPQGLLAVGGDLSVERLILAYRSGIFPWYDEGQPLLWWSPDPRLVLFPEKLRVSKSLRRIIQSRRFRVTRNRDFEGVIRNCSNVKRRDQDRTWITAEMVRSYCALHEAGHAHSVEVWEGDRLVGGLYGVRAGRCFCGESMFAHVSNASKIGFVWLVDRLREENCVLIDCQVATRHLMSLGAEEISRTEYLTMLRDCLAAEDRPGSLRTLPKGKDTLALNQQLSYVVNQPTGGRLTECRKKLPS